MNFSEFQDRIVQWAGARGITTHSTAQTQLLKGVTEFGELIDATLKADRAGMVDGVGDTVVTMLIAHQIATGCGMPATAPRICSPQLETFTQGMLYAFYTGLSDEGYIPSATMLIAHNTLYWYATQFDIDPPETYRAVWDEIKDRRGYMTPEGVFVKEDT